VRTHKLYLAATSSAKTYGGVPALGAGTNFIVCYFGYMVIAQADILHFRGYVWPIIFFAVHALMVAAVEYDPACFRIIEVAFDTFTIRSTLWPAPPYATRRLMEPTRAL
jgi:hypothetical protein